MPDEQQEWHVERGIPLAGIITLVVLMAGQTATAAWWVSKIESRVDHLEQTASMVSPQAERLTKVEVKLDVAIDTLKDIQRSLTRTPR